METHLSLDYIFSDLESLEAWIFAMLHVAKHDAHLTNEHTIAPHSTQIMPASLFLEIHTVWHSMQAMEATFLTVIHGLTLRDAPLPTGAFYAKLVGR